MSENNSGGAESPANLNNINVTGDGGFDIATLAELTKAEGDTPDVSDNTPAALLNDPDVPTAILQENDDAQEEDDGGQKVDVSSGAELEGKERADSSSEGEAQEPAQGVETVAIKHGDKEYKIPKEGEVELTINGKKEKLPFQEVLNKASGAVHIERKTSELGRKEKQFKEVEEGFKARVKEIETDLAALRELEDPYEICEYVAALQKKDPNKVFEEMVQKTVNFLERRSKMTPEQIEIERENRRLKLFVKKTETQQKLHQEEALRAQKAAELDQELQEYSFTKDDFIAAVEELKERLSAGEEVDLGIDKDEAITKDTIIDYMIARDLNTRVETAVNSINSELKNDSEFMREVTRAITLAESLTGKLSEAELKKVVQARIAQTKKATGESLSKKVRERSKSELANSLEQDEDDEGLDVSNLAEYFSAMRNL